MKGVEQPPQFHPEGDVWIHTRHDAGGAAVRAVRRLSRGACCCMTSASRQPSRRLQGRMSRIRFDRHVEVGTRMAEEICRRLRFSNADTEQIAALVANHLRFKDVPQMKPATLKRFARLERFDEHLELHRLDCCPAIAIWKCTSSCADSWPRRLPRRFILPACSRGTTSSAWVSNQGRDSRKSWKPLRTLNWMG